MASTSQESNSFSQISDNIRKSTAEKLKLFESIRGKQVDGSTFWDIIVLTALDESQRDAYDIQLQFKLARGELPLGVKYHVFYDPPGPKIGNGGSVLVTIGDLLKIYDVEELMKAKIIMLPAGGYSQRLPNASVLGKAFTALPVGTFICLNNIYYVCSKNIEDASPKYYASVNPGGGGHSTDVWVGRCGPYKGVLPPGQSIPAQHLPPPPPTPRPLG